MYAHEFMVQQNTPSVLDSDANDYVTIINISHSRPRAEESLPRRNKRCELDARVSQWEIFFYTSVIIPSVPLNGRLHGRTQAALRDRDTFLYTRVSICYTEKPIPPHIGSVQNLKMTAHCLLSMICL